ncbi:serine/threonine protein phosphatase, partial [Staphylococcus hominis]
MEELTKSYKALVKKSILTKNKTILTKECVAVINEVIKNDVLPEDVVEIHKDHI